MKKLIILLAILLMSFTSAFSQDCNSAKVLIVGGIGFTPQTIGASVRLGLWQNTGKSGVTLFGGYAVNIEHSLGPQRKNGVAHPDSIGYDNALFAEIGYKQRLSETLFLHAGIGLDRIVGYYPAAGFLYQASNDLLGGIEYRRGKFEICFYFKINN